MASSFLPAPRHWPTTVIRPIPTPMAAIPFRFSRMFVIAWAAMAMVPRVDTEDWIDSFPSWNMLFSTPDGIPSERILPIIFPSGRIW